MTLSAPGQRLDHSQLMDRVYRHQRHFYDATRKYYLLGRDRAIDTLAMDDGQSLLEIGCGTGRNLARAGRLYPGARLYGLDISSEMLATARKVLSQRLQSPQDLRQRDAANFSPADFATSGFNRIMISYALSMIPDWKATLACAMDALAPGGRLHIVDFGDQSDLPVWFKSLLRSWLRQFHVTPRDELRNTLESLIAGKPYRLEFSAHARTYACLASIERLK